MPFNAPPEWWKDLPICRLGMTGGDCEILIDDIVAFESKIKVSASESHLSGLLLIDERSITPMRNSSLELEKLMCSVLLTRLRILVHLAVSWVYRRVDRCTSGVNYIGCGQSDEKEWMMDAMYLDVKEQINSG